ncbi:LysM peptidoglycan-binding domain-containing protein [Pyxidicoccus fallax]|uniref:LysM peptidoglycan-binding domain-containing protein n=1 Tax=Pyxidicoccus fallax TaxID=394095 RepID=A0A848M038_9BACT|nr:peptidoglycan-binding protein [Pyxidicoccus fallax]NMO22754.1 LysM peptidoglycan-binding domain-containing protein [Pyxidicoccus fallax]NPC84915.1 LysM peptidoglycan-binding domain-containing protein [Pyxidicoccus fallax]
MAEETPGPVGQGDYVVREGDCVSSIAEAAGLHWRTLWEHPGNRELRETRGSPHVLLVGDRLTLPPKQTRVVSVGTGATHRFRVKGRREKFRLRLLDEDRPRAGVDYRLVVDGEELYGTTDGGGWLEHWIAPGAREGRLSVEEDEEYLVDLGALQPAATEAGALARLLNLGYLVPGDEKEPGALALGLKAFQRVQGLKVTGILDAATISALVEDHGS